MSDLQPPQKRYRVTITCDVHHGQHLVDLLRSIVGDLYRCSENDPPPIHTISGGGWAIESVERDDWVCEGAYPAALSEWFEASRKAKRDE